MATGPAEQKRRYLRYLELVTGSIEEKRRYRQFKARIRELPENYRTAVEALERYLMYFGRGDGTGWASMYEDLVVLFEQSAANGTPIREIFGEDPVEFVETFMQNYPEGRWISRERERFVGAIERAAGEDSGNEGGTAR
jgi:DNA-binding ferritin-like protein (Dps family)